MRVGFCISQKPLIIKYIQQKIGFYNDSSNDPEHKETYNASILAAIEKNKELLNLSVVNADYYILANRFPVNELKLVHEYAMGHEKK